MFNQSPKLRGGKESGVGPTKHREAKTGSGVVRAAMKVLGLHGSQQNADVFYDRCSRLVSRAQAKKFINIFYCCDAPHELPLKDGDQVRLRSWYKRQSSGAVEFADLEESLRSIERVWQSCGPFNCIIGFSQGGAVAAVVAALPQRFPGLKTLVIAGAPDLGPGLFVDGVTIPEDLASLHFIGRADSAVPPESSRTLAHRFNNPEIVEHDMGHCLPAKAAQIEAFLTFMSKQVGSRAIGGPTNAALPAPAPKAATKPTSHVAEALLLCASDEVAQMQSEEVEVLTAMYPDEITLLSPGHHRWPAPQRSDSVALPTKKGDPCAAFHVTLVLDPALFEPGAAVGFPAQWPGNIGLLFRLTPSYPLSEAPLVSVTTGKLTLADGFSDARVASLEAAVQSACVGMDGAFLGEACAMLCIQAAGEWFSTGRWRDASAASTATGSARGQDSCVQVEEDGEEGEGDDDTEGMDSAQEAEYIRLATQEACSTACRMRERFGHAGLERRVQDLEGSAGANGRRRDEAEAPLLPPSARGVWDYTVGLVGKPSAGKSTFYNAVTRAALERGGRLMAEVAPHPFTTIEPNVGPGWYASPQTESEVSDEYTRQLQSGDAAAADREQYLRRPLHGRVSQSTSHTLAGRRLLPVVVKDVAGLVPGAYKGRGKGNRFLADLCDADVLVHVLDVTGSADKDGNAVVAGDGAGQGQGDKGSTPMEDAEWIREELHRWIHGNVRAKWASVTACTRVKGKAGAASTQQQRERTAQRVFELFTGYQGPKWCTERAAERAGLELELAGQWNELDLHRMVAHFLSVRFPVCLALNKIDALPEGEEAERAVAHCQEVARQRGEVAVPVSARAECAMLNRLAAASAGGSGRKGASVEEDALHGKVMARFGSTGVIEAISAAVALKPPVLVYPVCDLDSECPVGWTPGKGEKAVGPPRLQDCLRLKPGSTVGDAFEALKRGVLCPTAGVLHGEFVRADGRALLTASAAGVGSEGSGRVTQLRKDTVLDSAHCVLRIQTNRKSVWQNTAPAAGLAAECEG